MQFTPRKKAMSWCHFQKKKKKNCYTFIVSTFFFSLMISVECYLASKIPCWNLNVYLKMMYHDVLENLKQKRVLEMSFKEAHSLYCISYCMQNIRITKFLILKSMYCFLYNCTKNYAIAFKAEIGRGTGDIFWMLV